MAYLKKKKKVKFSVLEIHWWKQPLYLTVKEEKSNNCK